MSKIWEKNPLLAGFDPVRKENQQFTRPVLNQLRYRVNYLNKFKDVYKLKLSVKLREIIKQLMST